MQLLVLGAGFAGGVAARCARERGLSVFASTRRPERAIELEAMGVRAHVGAPTNALAALQASGAVSPDELGVLVAFPPDPVTDAALVERLASVRALVYVSSTGVYGAASRVDHTTEVARTGLGPRNELRLEAEARYRSVGACIVRVPAIYGPERGLHVRLAAGTLRLPEGGHASSRIHVEDLADALVSILSLGLRDVTFVAADRFPASHREVVTFLCERMQLPMPASVAVDQVDESLRVERIVDASQLWARLGREPRFPSYREGFAQALGHRGG